MKITKWIITFYYLTLLPDIIYSQTHYNLENKVKNHIQNSSISSGEIGIHLYSISEEKTILGIEKDRFFIPASSQKIITSFLALDLLGFDFQYQTKLYYTKKIDPDGTLQGNLIVVGSGDPSLGSWRPEINNETKKVLKNLSQAVKNTGITCIDGEVWIDASRYDYEFMPMSWAWSDVGNYYGGGTSGLNFHENEYKVFFNRDAGIGESAKIHKIVPMVPGLQFHSLVQIDNPGTGDNAYIYGGQDNWQKIIRGTIPYGKSLFSIRGSIPNPPLFFAHQLAEELQANNIAIQGYGYADLENLGATNLIHTIKSAKLSNLVQLANTHSINLYSESFYKSLSPAGTRSEARKIAFDKLQNHGLDTNDVWLVDGSGLSSENVIKPAFFTQFLHYYQKLWGLPKVCTLLPKVGETGTVKNLMKSKNWTGEAYLKSGYMKGVLTYTGYIKGKSGKWYCLSFMCNHFRQEINVVRSLFEVILQEIYLYS